MRIKTLILLTGLAIPLISGCDQLTFKRGNGEMVIITEYVDDFDEIVLNGIFEVFLDKGEEGKVVVHVDENLQDYVDIYSKEDALSIRITEKVKSREGIKVFISYTELRRLTSAGASIVATDSPITGDDLRLTLSGAGVMDMEVELNDLKVRMTGAGLIKLKGRVTRSDISLTGAGSLEAFDLETEDCEISISGVGGAQVNVSGTLDATISGIGGIKVAGDPQKINRNISGIGKIKSVRTPSS